MIAQFHLPVASMQGSITQRGNFYFRILNGKCIAQRKPNRSAHIPTEAELRNRERFRQQYATNRKPSKHLPNSSSIRGVLTITFCLIWEFLVSRLLI